MDNYESENSEIGINPPRERAVVSKQNKKQQR